MYVLLTVFCSELADVDLCVLQPAVVCGFQELTGSLQDLLTQALEYIKEQEIGITALKLAGLSLEGPTEVSVQTHGHFLSHIPIHSFIHRETT